MPSIGLIRTPRNRLCFHPSDEDLSLGTPAGSPRTCVRLLWRRLQDSALRQHEVCGEEDSARISAGGDGSDHSVSLALGLSERVLQPSQRQRKRRRRRGAGMVPAQLACARARGQRSGRIEPTSIGRLYRQPRPHYHRKEHDHRRGQRVGARTLIAAGGGRFSDPRVTLSTHRGQQGPREGEDQLVFDLALARAACDGGSRSVDGRDPARQQGGCAVQTLLRTRP